MAAQALRKIQGRREMFHGNGARRNATRKRISQGTPGICPQFGARARNGETNRCRRRADELQESTRSRSRMAGRAARSRRRREETRTEWWTGSGRGRRRRVMWTKRGTMRETDRQREHVHPPCSRFPSRERWATGAQLLPGWCVQRDVAANIRPTPKNRSAGSPRPGNRTV